MLAAVVKNHGLNHEFSDLQCLQGALLLRTCDSEYLIVLMVSMVSKNALIILSHNMGLQRRIL